LTFLHIEINHIPLEGNNPLNSCLIIALSYLIRALFYAVVGLIIGILAFKYLIIPVEARHPFEFPFGPAYLLTQPSYTVRMAVILLVVSLAAAFIPVWRVMRIKILDAIWG